jgi:dTDP-4-amino-4,6-dideoxygalactose transaminase
MLRFYREKFGYSADDFPGARAANDNSMSIPLHNMMSDEDYRYVASQICGL